MTWAPCALCTSKRVMANSRPEMEPTYLSRRGARFSMDDEECCKCYLDNNRDVAPLYDLPAGKVTPPFRGGLKRRLAGYRRRRSLAEVDESSLNCGHDSLCPIRSA